MPPKNTNIIQRDNLCEYYDDVFELLSNCKQLISYHHYWEKENTKFQVAFPKKGRQSGDDSSFVSVLEEFIELARGFNTRWYQKKIDGLLSYAASECHATPLQFGDCHHVSIAEYAIYLSFLSVLRFDFIRKEEPATEEIKLRIQKRKTNVADFIVRSMCEHKDEVNYEIIFSLLEKERLNVERHYGLLGTSESNISVSKSNIVSDDIFETLELKRRDFSGRPLLLIEKLLCSPGMHWEATSASLSKLIDLVVEEGEILSMLRSMITEGNRQLQNSESGLTLSRRQIVKDFRYNVFLKSPQ